MLPSHVLASAVGLRLERADVQWHVSPGQEDSLMRFWLTFGGRSFGFHVGAEDEILDVIIEERGTDAEMGIYGRLEVRPAADDDPAAAAVGQRLVVVHDLYAGYLGKPIGARLSFETVDLSVADWEDELHWAVGDLPPAVGVRHR
ncbi:hypothetical protein KZZ52_09355 [Dactylosporangium sp. AC04546]|uniref:hypothetical protein n=1 Tax=Dactylosporangium sp. AC04546 TaxID=2862460 RepID=UPI001EDC961C|nr:hypothetical protein [Dactylosporangium sp. AC04546]WVK85573.1 hypothetical protein KZZ52_09355 [Dactylosporangium sp. AC04546]